MDEVRGSNLQLKNDIVQKAIALSESLDWEKTANDLKELQRQWKEVGPVPEKFREKIYAEFKKACDHFFEKRRIQFDKAEKEQEDNLLKKVAICEKLETLTSEKTGTLEMVNDLQKQFNAIGFVPKNAVVSIKNRFAASTEKFFASIDHVSADERDRAMLEIQLANLKNDPDGERKIFQKEQTIRKKISKVENDLAVLLNNLEFFGRSKNADKLKEEFNEKIKEIDQEIKKQAIEESAIDLVYQAVSGIGHTSARVLANELGNLQQFKNERQLFSYIGFTPSEHSSGEHTRQGHITKQGKPIVRKILVQAAWIAIRHDKGLQGIYERIARKSGAKRAIVAVARRLIGRIRACFRTGEVYIVERVERPTLRFKRISEAKEKNKLTQKRVA